MIVFGGKNSYLANLTYTFYYSWLDTFPRYEGRLRRFNLKFNKYICVIKQKFWTAKTKTAVQSTVFRF